VVGIYDSRLGTMYVLLVTVKYVAESLFIYSLPIYIYFASDCLPWYVLLFTTAVNQSKSEKFIDCGKIQGEIMYFACDSMYQFFSTCTCLCTCCFDIS